MASQQSPEALDPALFTPPGNNGIAVAKPLAQQEELLPPHHLPSFTNAIDAHSNHLLKPGWCPSTGTFGLPTNGDGLTDDADLMPYVCRLFNAFVDVSEIYDEAEHPELAQRFKPNGVWTQNLDDVEAISHLIVDTVLSLHKLGAKGLQFRRLLSKLPTPDSESSRLTFAQRLWLVEKLVRHYKKHADTLMKQNQVEEILVMIWNALFDATDYKVRWTMLPEAERYEYTREFHMLGTPGSQPKDFNVILNAMSDMNRLPNAAHMASPSRSMERKTTLPHPATPHSINYQLPNARGTVLASPYQHLSVNSQSVGAAHAMSPSNNWATTGGSPAVLQNPIPLSTVEAMISQGALSSPQHASRNFAEFEARQPAQVFGGGQHRSERVGGPYQSGAHSGMPNDGSLGFPANDFPDFFVGR